MPFTFSHPAIVLPLVRKSGHWFSATGLIIGSLTPDFEYFMRMRIVDNGCGFDPQTASRAPGHWGLTTMRERAHTIGAEFTLLAETGRGTQIEITIPEPE